MQPLLGRKRFRIFLDGLFVPSWGIFSTLWSPLSIHRKRLLFSEIPMFLHNIYWLPGLLGSYFCSDLGTPADLRCLAPNFTAAGWNAINNNLIRNVIFLVLTFSLTKWVNIWHQLPPTLMVPCHKIYFYNTRIGLYIETRQTIRICLLSYLTGLSSQKCSYVAHSSNSVLKPTNSYPRKA